MAWDEIDQAKANKADIEKAQKELRQAQSDFAKKVHRLFASDDGKDVLAHLTDRFIMNNATDLGSSNINYEAAYRNGEAGVVKYLIHQMQKAKVL